MSLDFLSYTYVWGQDLSENHEERCQNPLNCHRTIIAKATALVHIIAKATALVHIIAKAKALVHSFFFFFKSPISDQDQLIVDCVYSLIPTQKHEIRWRNERRPQK